MKIILTGSLGHIGKPLTEQLVKEGHSLTVISSSLKRKNEIEALGANSAIGSLKDAEFLTKTFKGADAVHCMVPPVFHHNASIDPMQFYTDLGNSYKTAIQNSGVKRVTHLSSFGAHLPAGTGFIVGSHNVEQILNSLAGVDVTHIRPTSFYYNFNSFIPMIKNSGGIYANYGGTKTIQMVSPKDIATTIAEEILKGNSEKIRYVASDERTGDEVAKVLGNAIGKINLKWVVISDEEMKKALEKSGMASHLANGLTELYKAFREGKLSEDYLNHKPTLGNVKLEDFAVEFSKTYSKN